MNNAEDARAPDAAGGAAIGSSGMFRDASSADDGPPSTTPAAPADGASSIGEGEEGVDSPESSDSSGGGAPVEPLDDSPGSSSEAAVDSSSVDELADEISAEFTELDELIKERDDYLDSLRRLQADFENYRKRMQRQEADAAERGAADLVTKLLPVLDTVELALAHHPGDAVAQVASSFEDALFKEGLERVPGAGSLFDPTEHDAVVHEEGDGPGEVVEVLRSGYRWRGRVLRAAMVKVKGS